MSNQELVWYPRVVPTAARAVLYVWSRQLRPARLQALREVRPAGIEPAACGLKDRCSLTPRRESLTTELRALGPSRDARSGVRNLSTPAARLPRRARPCSASPGME